MSSHPSSDKKSAYDKFLDLISRVSIVITGIAMVVLTAIFGWLVFGRYVLNSTPTWVEQVSLLLVMLIGFLGASVGIHKNTHLGVSFFREISPRPVRRAFEFVSHIMLAVFGAVMAVYSYELVLFTLLYSVGHLIHFFQGIEEEPSDITK